MDINMTFHNTEITHSKFDTSVVTNNICRYEDEQCNEINIFFASCVQKPSEYKLQIEVKLSISDIQNKN